MPFIRVGGDILFSLCIGVFAFSPRLPTSTVWWTRYVLVSASFPFLAWHSPTNPSPDLEASGLRRLKRRGSRPVHFEQVERKRCGSHRHIQAAAHQASTARWCRKQLNAANLHISYAYPPSNPETPLWSKSASLSSPSSASSSLRVLCMFPTTVRPMQTPPRTESAGLPYPQYLHSANMEPPQRGAQHHRHCSPPPKKVPGGCS